MTRNLKTSLWEYRAPSERSRKDVFHASLVSSGDCQQSLDSTTISLGKESSQISLVTQSTKVLSIFQFLLTLSLTSPSSWICFSFCFMWFYTFPFPWRSCRFLGLCPFAGWLTYSLSLTYGIPLGKSCVPIFLLILYPLTVSIHMQLFTCYCLKTFSLLQMPDPHKQPNWHLLLDVAKPHHINKLKTIQFKLKAVKGTEII